ncbi:endonuclease Q family protein [Streptomyces sp. TRM 70361]|uniref:endonuclease Q family protein n=1 Tax=Streptomyces sp. TRM 70361 TaxID=3116553 RepID=UPI002E7C4DCE|nr:endonuclease Q family protein [Streptomyces sp. TRM 70361]MEE1941241.1 endonuclease Q family protein [Streptomyces sp. TRM 70361]
MRHYADLHIHSRYSRACSRALDLRQLARWARRKGITVLGTGDFTHPGWAAELREELVPAEPGLFRLRDETDHEVLETLPPTCRGPLRFTLQTEVATNYTRGGRGRRLHHLCHVPGFEAVERLTRALTPYGALASDGRPALAMDARDLLEAVLAAGEGAFLVPAHIWTPWFGLLGSKSGFDSVAECYGDLTEHVFALETGLSSDPEMNWRVSALDRFRLVSHSDAHSAPALGRNATVFDTDLDYFALRRALATGEGYAGTVDLYPEEGKYHLDGHRACGVRLTPAETRELGGRCPVCGRRLTVGVLHRVEELADHRAGRRPETAGEPLKIVPLPEIVGEILGVGPKSKAVGRAVDSLTAALGPELPLLLEVPLERLREAGEPEVAEAVGRLRAHRVRRESGYDGVYGTVSLAAAETGTEPGTGRPVPAAGARRGAR